MPSRTKTDKTYDLTTGQGDSRPTDEPQESRHGDSQNEGGVDGNPVADLAPCAPDSTVPRASAHPSIVKRVASDIDSVLAGCKAPGHYMTGYLAASSTRIAIKTIPIAAIKLDKTFDSRQITGTACSGDEISTEDGVADFTGEHPAIIWKQGEVLALLSGFRRIRAAKQNSAVTDIKCLLVTNISEHEAVIIAARSNLRHGQQLSCTERKRCFLRELAARRAAGYPNLSNRAWARIFAVSPVSIGAWQGAFDSIPAGPEPERLTVQIGHSADSDRLNSEPVTVTVEPVKNTEDRSQPISGCIEFRPRQPKPATVAIVGNAPQPSAAEAIAAFQAAVAMLAEVPVVEHAENLDALRNGRDRLSKLIDELDALVTEGN